MISLNIVANIQVELLSAQDISTSNFSLYPAVEWPIKICLSTILTTDKPFVSTWDLIGFIVNIDGKQSRHDCHIDRMKLGSFNEHKATYGVTCSGKNSHTGTKGSYDIDSTLIKTIFH